MALMCQVNALFLCFNLGKGCEVMTITEYINQKQETMLIPFMSMYRTIILLIEDGIIPKDKFDSVFAEEKNVGKVQS